jgi:Rab-like protein 3
MEPRDRVRILVLGDAGVGKTSLVHQLAFATPAAASVTSTIGVTLEVRLHEYREGTPQKKTFWIGS